MSALALLAPTLSAASLQARHPGHWSPADTFQTYIAVHMALLPSAEPSVAHSKIVWWAESHHNPNAVLSGKVWNWKPIVQDACTSYPFGNFVGSETLNAPETNIFCTGLAPTRDGRLFVSGGTETAEYGSRHNWIFNPATSSWASGGMMSGYRWYPDVCTLTNGHLLISSGSSYNHTIVFGGKESAQADPDSVIGRFATNLAGLWDAAIAPTQGQTWPQARSYHAASGGNLICGGEDALGRPLIDVWDLDVDDAEVTADDLAYRWSQRQPAGTAPPKRRRHVAVATGGDTLWVIGGLGRNQADTADSVLSDVWRMYKNEQSRWVWSEVTVTGDTIPGPRFGHAAVYDPAFGRILLFGGAGTVGGAAVDTEVYVLDINNPSAPHWGRAVPRTPVRPPKRLGHAMLYDASQEPRGADPKTTSEYRVVVFGGETQFGSGYLGDAWHLWIDSQGRVEWKEITNIIAGTAPTPRAWFGSVLDGGGRLIIHGGETSGGAVSDGQVYGLFIPFQPPGFDEVDKTWQSLAAPGFALSGQTMLTHPYLVFARRPETVVPGDSTTWHQLAPRAYHEWYPFVFAMPNGDAFVAGPSIDSDGSHAYPTYEINVSTGEWSALPVSGGSGFKGGSAVMYRPGRIMKCGSRDTEANTDAVATTKAVNLNLASPTWQSSTAMRHARANHNLTVLPGGDVLVTGGTGFVSNPANQSPVYEPELWHPSDAPDSTGAWYYGPGDTLAANPLVKGYHSLALLLPDGRVLSAGGFNSADATKMDIYCPPYLFKSNGELAARPVISGSPASLAWGKTFTVCVSDWANISGACLIRPAAATHAFDQNQRYVPLQIAGHAGNPQRLFVTAPADSNVAPPGYHLLFLTGSADGTDVPSIATWVNLNAPGGLDLCDSVPPNAIADLDFDVDPDDCTLFHLHWTAPGDDANLVESGPASQYNMKVSTASIGTTWSGGAALSPAPRGAGNTESTDVSVGVGQSRYIRIKTKDDNNNWADGSNQIHISGPPQHSDCSEGGGSFASGGGGGGERARPGAGPASVRQVAATWSGENTLLNGVAFGTRAGDLLHLPGCDVASGGTYLVRIREAAGHLTRLDDAQLLTVDHSSSVTTFMAAGKPVLGNRVPPTRATDGTGADVTAHLDGSTIDAFVGDSGAVLTVELGANPKASADPVVIEASGLGWSSSGILLQVPEGAQGWRTVGLVHPRLYFDPLAVDSVASDQVRLCFLGRHQVRFVGRVARSSELPIAQSARLLNAQSSRLGDALTAVAAADSTAATLAGPDTLLLSFSVPPLDAGQVRECFLAVAATPVSPQDLGAQPLRGSAVEAVPLRFALWQNQPNPFSASTTIRFDLPVGAMVRLEIFDVQGRRVKLVTNHYYPAGFQAVPWDRRDETGSMARPSVYLYRLTAGAFRAEKKMVLLP